MELYWAILTVIVLAMRAKAHKLPILARQAAASKLAADLAPEIEDIRRQGITSSLGIAQALNQRGYHAPRGGAWQATQVIRLLKAL